MVIVVFVITLIALPFILFSSITRGSEVLFPFCGFLLFITILLVVVFVTSASRGTSLPPPPPVQQPMVPAGTQGPIALSCPNCGAPPVNVDRFGVATCTYCGSRFLVR